MRAVLAISPTAFIAVWWAIQLFHVVCIVHAFAVIQIHRYCIATDLNLTINYMGVATFSYFKPVIAGYAVLIALHVAAFTATLWWSLRHCEWRFTSQASTTKHQHNRSTIRQAIANGIRRMSRSSVMPLATDIATGNRQAKVVDVVKKASQITKRLGSAAYKLVCKFSLNGQYYEIRFLVSELVEIVLQVYQAYKLSRLVSRVWINRLYAIVLVLNCWSTPLVYMRLRRDRLVQRILLRAMDALFDAITSMVIPFVVFYPYYMEFDTTRQDFPLVNYYSDVWFVQAISENRQVFVTSWIDYVSKILPGLSIFGSTLLLKRYIVMDKSTSRDTSKVTRVESTTTRSAGPALFKSLIDIMPTTKTRVVTGTSSRHMSVGAFFRTSSRGKKSARKTSRTESQQILIASLFTKYKGSWHDVLFVLCGLVILVIHIHTTVIGEFSSVKGCLLEVRPWFQTRHSCVALEVNCVHGQYAGGSNVDAIQEAMGDANIAGIRSFVIASCSNLHVPPVLQGMASLQMLKVYNSTIERWGPEAELLQDVHQDLQMLYMCHTNFTGGELPPGIVGNSFPKRLIDIEFSGTNLKMLPSNLHEKWTGLQYFVLEGSPGITEIPETVVKLKVPQVMMGWNSIEWIPDDLLTDQAFWTLLLDGNPLLALPQHIGSVVWLFKIGVSNTLVSSLPPWMNSTQYDPVTGIAVELVWSPAIVFAGGSPLCGDDSEVLRTKAMVYFEWDCSTDTPGFAYPVEQERVWRASSHAGKAATRG